MKKWVSISGDTNVRVYDLKPEKLQPGNFQKAKVKEWNKERKEWADASEENESSQLSCLR